MQTTVKKWLPDKGYGFLHNGGDAPDILVHSNVMWLVISRTR
jgi:cold shock CspA family protein